jgi:hypothetical protein
VPDAATSKAKSKSSSFISNLWPNLNSIKKIFSNSKNETSSSTTPTPTTASSSASALSSSSSTSSSSSSSLSADLNQFLLNSSSNAYISNPNQVTFNQSQPLHQSQPSFPSHPLDDEYLSSEGLETFVQCNDSNQLLFSHTCILLNRTGKYEGLLEIRNNTLSFNGTVLPLTSCSVQPPEVIVKKADIIGIDDSFNSDRNGNGNISHMGPFLNLNHTDMTNNNDNNSNINNNVTDLDNNHNKVNEGADKLKYVGLSFHSSLDVVSYEEDESSDAASLASLSALFDMPSATSGSAINNISAKNTSSYPDNWHSNAVDNGCPFGLSMESSMTKFNNSNLPSNASASTSANSSSSLPLSLFELDQYSGFGLKASTRATNSFVKLEDGIVSNNNNIKSNRNNSNSNLNSIVNTNNSSRKLSYDIHDLGSKPHRDVDRNQLLQYSSSECAISVCIPLEHFGFVIRRRYNLQYNAIEIFFKNKPPTEALYFICYPLHNDDDIDHNEGSIYSNSHSTSDALKSSSVDQVFTSRIVCSHLYTIICTMLRQKLTGVVEEQITISRQLWVEGKLCNYKYLLILNLLSGRSFNDTSQYPVFPWVLKDYDSTVLDLGDPNVYRDLSKPIGALNEKNYAVYDSIFNEDTSSAPFFYGTLYSNQLTVYSYLFRTQPFLRHYLDQNGGDFDHCDRMFSSIGGMRCKIVRIDKDCNNNEFYDENDDNLVYFCIIE